MRVSWRIFVALWCVLAALVHLAAFVVMQVDDPVMRLDSWSFPFGIGMGAAALAAVLRVRLGPDLPWIDGIFWGGLSLAGIALAGAS